ncbi:hypothetical protein SCUCBS95973_004754 [Sporothrix curviconia]|uniref:Chromosome condensation protein n=1 Tax=Sporothrix curviconia TaxID=1260050 RepID=A0ABP0BRE9_9PEZI
MNQRHSSSSLPRPQPRPARRSISHSQSSHHEQSHSDGHSTISPQRTRSRNTDETEDDYDIPRTFSNLNEAEGPLPAENPDELPIARHHSLEEYREADAQDEREERAEAQTLPEPSPTTPKDGRWHERRRDTISRLRTEIYTVAYLVFFALLGTLARLGLVSLTTYAGAPVSFGILWANFAGTAVLGFLAELSPVINRDYSALAREAEMELEEPDGQEKDDADADVGANLGRSGSIHAAADSGNSTSTVAENAPPRPGDDDDEMNSQGGVNGAALDDVVSLAPVDDDPTPDPIVRRRPIPLYVGMATGFCGSFTSFSSFMRDVFDALANTLPAPQYHPTDVLSTAAISRRKGDDAMALLAVLFLTVCMCLSALKCGAHIAIFVQKLGARVQNNTPWLARHRGRRIPKVLHVADHVVALLAVLAWLAAVLLAVFQPGVALTKQWRGDVLFALVFAPLGCLLRFYISLKLNGVFATFPLGTFTVNILGTAVLGMAWDLQHSSAASAVLVSCQVLQGVMDGFCGCLTTVSTWMTELSGLRRRHAYFYGLSSLATGLSVLVIIMGSLKWTVGFQTPVCG